MTTTNLILASILLNSHNNGNGSPEALYGIIIIIIGILYIGLIVTYYLIIPLYYYLSKKFNKLLKVFNKKRAKRILKKSLAQYPTVSDYRRILNEKD